MQAERVRERISQFKSWYHRIELAPGVVTPGINDSPHVLRSLDAMGLPADLSGKRVLDLGCRDGFFCFEAERRGAAEVVGIDYAAPEVTGFPIAAEILGSKAAFRVMNIYDLDSSILGTFDVVFFLGLLYHLRDPLLALDRIRSMQDPGGLLYVETQLAAAPEVLASPVPLWQFFPGDSFAGDATNRWGPNLSGLVAAVRECEYRVDDAQENGDRGLVAASAVADAQTAFFRTLDRGLRRVT